MATVYLPIRPLNGVCNLSLHTYPFKGVGCNDHCYPENDCTVNKPVLCISQGETSLLLRFQKEVRNTRPLRTYLCEKVENGHFFNKRRCVLSITHLLLKKGRCILSITHLLLEKKGGAYWKLRTPF